MKEFLKQLFAENGTVSSMRFMAIMCCSTACYLALTKGESAIGIVSTLLGIAISGKCIQKISEK